MSFDARLVVVVLASFAAVSLLATALVPLALRRARGLAPDGRAAALLFARLVPAALGTVASLLVLAAYLRFEPRDEEPTGILIRALAALALLLITGSIARWAVMTWRTRTTIARWMRSARPTTLAGLDIPVSVVDSAFPIVAVVGAFKPRLIVARSVIDACPAPELDAVLAHERHHVARRDNLKRAVLAAVPDLLAWLPASNRIADRWREASEDAADDAAGRAGGRLGLASALVRVARLAPPEAALSRSSVSMLLPADGIERRVRRLLAPAAAQPRPRLRIGPALIAGVAGAPFGLGAVQRVIEIAVTHLP